MAALAEVNEYRFPLHGTRIHTQGEDTFIAVGADEAGKLRKPQKKGLQELLKESPYPSLVGFLNTDDGSIRFTQGDSPIVAILEKTGWYVFLYQ